jgi:hypothetical protein
VGVSTTTTPLSLELLTPCSPRLSGRLRSLQLVNSHTTATYRGTGTTNGLLSSACCFVQK